MRVRLINLWDRVRSSFWFVPAVVGLAALVLAIVMPKIDETLHDQLQEYELGLASTVDSARQMLSAMAQAMITVAGIVFSIAVVALSLTTSNFGSRLLRQFMRDNATQWAMGVLLSTSIYCLLVLRAIRDTEDLAIVPQLSVMLGVALAILSLAMLIYYVHHVAMMIQAPQVLASVSAELNEAVDRLFPERPSTSKEYGASHVAEPGLLALTLERFEYDRRTIASSHEGYLQALDLEALSDFAAGRDAVLMLNVQPGDFLIRQQCLAWLSPASAWEEGDDARVNKAVLTGTRRTPRQDLGCSVHEVAEVAVRALSSGINDPFTAINGIDRLAAVLGRLAQRDRSRQYVLDDQQRPRVLLQPFAFGSMLEAAFAPIRHYGAGSPLVGVRLLHGLRWIASCVQRPADKEAVAAQLDAAWQQIERSGYLPVEIALASKVRSEVERILSLDVDEPACVAPLVRQY